MFDVAVAVTIIAATAAAAAAAAALIAALTIWYVFDICICIWKGTFELLNKWMTAKIKP